MPNDPTQLRSEIERALLTGATLALDYETILACADPNSLGDALIAVEISGVNPAAASLSSLSQVSAVLGGQSLTSLVPNGILPSSVLNVQSVTFTLFTQSKSVGGVSCAVAFSSNGRPLQWKIAQLGSASKPADLEVTIETITVTWSEPFKPLQMFGAVVYGSADIGNLPLDVTLTFPDITIVIEEPKNQQVNLGAFFDQFDLPKLAFLDDLILRNFNLSASPGDRSFQLGATMETEGLKPLRLLTIGGRTVLAFDNMWFSLSHAPGVTSGQMGGQITVLEKLVLGVRADFDTQNGSWDFGGEIDIVATWMNFNAGSPPAEPDIKLSQIVQMLVPNSNPPGLLNDLGIAALSFEYLHTQGAGGSYKLDGIFDGVWPIGDGLSSQVEITHDADSTILSGKFTLGNKSGGINFELRYTCIAGSSTIGAKIDAGDLLSMSGTYDGETVTLQLDKPLCLDKLVAWLVGEIKGDRYFALPDPWATVLAQAKIPDDFKLKINTKTKTVDCSITFADPPSFLGLTLEGVDISYDPSKAKGKKSSGLNFKLTTNLPDWVTDGNWDPATQQPPAVPGSTPALLDIRMLGAGQHIGFLTAPTTVEQAVQDLATAIDPDNWTGGLYPASMAPSTDIGWLLGSHVKLLGQVDIQFIFNDPIVYGLALNVTHGKSDLLNVLTGLSAEIIYRKVSDTVGVYEGTLTLPSDIAKIDLNQVVITLPQFALSIYTNGDFKIDVGFPYNRDFSRSCSVVAAEYAGAGGFYYAKLDGLDPSELPQIDTKKGVFSPVTEIGIGFQVGVTKGFSSGPLSASFSVMLQGIFQGVFAKFTLYPADAKSVSRQDEFYAVEATVAIVGHLIGELDFYIITASLEVTVYIEVDLRLAAYKQTQAEVSVGVDVELTVSINCGLFTIHIHCGFSTTVHAQATFGAAGQGLWEQIPPPAAQAVRAVRMMRAGDDAPTTVGWQPIADTAPLTVYFIPQLTAGLTYPQGDGLQWYYVGQLALSNPTEAGAQPASYAQFVRGVLRWALNAINNPGSDTPIPAHGPNSADAKTISRKQVCQLHDLLSKSASGLQPKRPDVKAQFKSAFQTVIAPMLVPDGAKSADYHVGFFPLIPDMAVTLQGDDQAPLARAAAHLSPARLRNAKRGGPPGAPPTTFLAHLNAPMGAPPDGAQPVTDLMMVDFAVAAICAGLQQILDSKKLPRDADNQPIDWSETIAYVLDQLDDADLSNIAGTTTRFMLHGTRRHAGGDSGPMEPLYALTGQQITVPAAKQKLAMTLSFASGAPGDWGISFSGGGSSLTLSSNDPKPAVFSPGQIPSTPSFAPGNLTVAPLPVFDVRPARYYLKTGIAEKDGAGIWRLPQALADDLPNVGDDTFAVYRVKIGDDGKETDEAVAATFVFTLDFQVRRIPTLDGTPGYLDNTYEMFSVDQAGIQSLQTLVTELTSKDITVSKLALAYASAPTGSSAGTTSREVVVTPINFANTFIVQSNFSTETRPPPASAMLLAAAQQDPAILLFLTKLWTAGITNSGGYYLFDTPDGHSGLPASLFDSSGTATLTLVVDIVKSSGQLVAPVKLPPYVTGLRTPDYPVGAKTSLYISGQKANAAHPLLPPGHIGVDISCDVPPAPTEPSVYGNALNHLYNLITAESVSIGGKPLARSGLPPVFGPVNPNSSTRWQYRHAFPLVGTLPDPPPTPPPDALNPYAAIGQNASFDLVWTDVFGNEWGPVKSDFTTPLRYYDPLISLSQLPYLSLDYMFSGKDQAAQLEIGFYFVTPIYGPKDAARRQSDIAAYLQAYYQLSDIASGPQVTATVATSLLTGAGMPATVSLDAIRSNVAQVYAILVAQPVGADPAPKPDPVTLQSVTLAVPASGTQLNAALYYALTVSLTFTRNGPLADKVPADGPVRTITMTIAPRTAQAAGDSHSLTAFAKAFEQAFAAHDLVLAVGAGQGLANGHQVWVVRYGATGISINMQKATPVNFAPRPLNNKLASASVSVRQLEQDGKLGEPSTIAATDIDLDAQMQKFLNAVDLIFSAADAIPAALINQQAINDLSDQKKAIVEKLVGYVTDLETGESFGAKKHDPSEPIAAAADRYRQECRIRMSAFYDMNAVTVPMVGNDGTDAPNMQLFGHPVLPDTTPAAQSTTDEKEFTLTSGKCALQRAATPMAIGLFAKHASSHGQFTGTPTFWIDALQHDVTPIPIDGQTYEVGSWLKFINPRAALTMPPLTIPIPLRAFPQPPQLIRQFAVELSADPDAPTSSDVNVLLKRAKSWSLNGTYQHTYAAQDTVHLDVKVNSGIETVHAVMATGGKPLLNALVEFNQIYPQLQAAFATGHLTTVRTPDDAKEAKTLNYALQSFATLVDEVAGAVWPSLQPAMASMMAIRGDSLKPRETQYTIQDGAQQTDDPHETWRSVVTFEKDITTPGVGIIPQLQIDGCRTAVDKQSAGSITYKFEYLDKKGYLDAEAATQIPTRTVAVLPPYNSSPFTPLDIVDRQNGLLSMMIGRNENLKPPIFHYQTPWVTYPVMLSPIFDTSDRFDIAGVGQPNGTPASRSIPAHLTALFTLLLAGSGEETSLNGSFQVVTYFAYPPNMPADSKAALSLVDLPIALRLPTAIQFDAPISGRYIKDMADAINTWLSANGLSASARPELWKRSELRFDLSLFSNAEVSGRPILRLRQLFLACKYIV